jgi:hypothetical protein
VVRSTEVAIAYVIVGLTYLGMVAMLLWYGMVGHPSTVVRLLVAVLINLVVAGILHRYDGRSSTVRLLGVALALGLFLVSCDDAIQTSRSSASGQSSAGVVHGVTWLQLIYLLMYGWLAFEVLRLARASNNRRRGP